LAISRGPGEKYLDETVTRDMTISREHVHRLENFSDDKKYGYKMLCDTRQYSVRKILTRTWGQFQAGTSD